MTFRRRWPLTLTLALLASAVMMPSPQARGEMVRFQEVESGKIYRGGQPESLADYALLQRLGIHTIINLKTTRQEIEQEAALAKSFGMTMISRPTGTFFGATDEEVDEIQSLLQDPKLQPLLIHCRHGKDRTGLMIGIYRVETQGWGPQEAYSEMLSLGFNPLLLGLRHRFWERMEHKPPLLNPAFY